MPSGRPPWLCELQRLERVLRVSRSHEEELAERLDAGDRGEVGGFAGRGWPTPYGYPGWA
ncbi:hypothetical protein BKM31_12820 [[Actinomadura] parvosata subsp. kistnae]|uniref:Uncharacterized protein n=1 Tax=[Actinomadura] parvosata subsp. kistnae TaxID=1909395 RepID=A0A1U9ZWA8_9ACTN|nr:hypothetical protein BKM31_12820 [Nonomuraea sp. ATCC 55076]